jgi:hypothetical protein
VRKAWEFVFTQYAKEMYMSLTTDPQDMNKKNHASAPKEVAELVTNTITDFVAGFKPSAATLPGAKFGPSLFRVGNRRYRPAGIPAQG